MKTKHHLQYALLGLLCVLFAQGSLLAQTCAIEVVATPTKPVYSRDDLIDVSVRFTNQGGTDELLRIKYPTLRYAMGVFAAVHSDKADEVGQGLRVLSFWKEDLPESEVRELLSKKNTALQVTMLNYVGLTHKRAYRATAEAYVQDANPEIAKAASLALTQLTK